MRLFVVAAGLALLFFPSLAAGSGQEPVYSKNARPVNPPAEVTSNDGLTSVTVSWLDNRNDEGWPSLVRVTSGGRVLEQRFEFGLNAEVLWSPESSRFAITGSDTGANAQYHTAVVTVTPSGLEWLDVTPIAEERFGHPVACGWPEPPNVGAVAWLSSDRLLLAAEIADHSNCDSHGTFVAYEIRVADHRIDRVHTQLEAKKRWGTVLGREIASAPDECVRDPKSCQVGANHVEESR